MEKEGQEFEAIWDCIKQSQKEKKIIAFLDIWLCQRIQGEYVTDDPLSLHLCDFPLFRSISG